MCEPLTLVSLGVTVASTAASMASAASQQSTAAKNASRVARTTNEATLNQSQADYAQQEETMRYQDETWQQDLDYATQTLTFQQGQFAKQTEYVKDAGKAILDNAGSQAAQVALQAVQKNIAITLGEANTNTQAAEARASARAAADGRGAAGNSVDAIIQDVSRQAGQAIGTQEMNRDAINNQARVDLQAVKAGSDTALGNLQASLKVYSPSTQIRAPGPVGGVQAPSLVSTPETSSVGNALAIGAAGLSGAATGLKLTSDLSGTSTRDLVQGWGKGLGIT